MLYLYRIMITEICCKELRAQVKLFIVTICKNEEKTIKELIDRIPRRIDGIDQIDIALVDDGSTDATAKIAKKAGATVIGDGIWRGLAVQFRRAANYALENDYDVMVNIDGDLQFAPEDIPKFVAPIISNEADFVAADRFTDPETGEERQPENMPSAKYYGNKLGSWIVGKLSKQSFRDVTCGYRAYNRDALYALNTNGTKTYTQESFQVLAAKGMRIATVPVVVKYFKDRKSRVVSSVPAYIIMSGLNILRAFRDFAPLRFFVIVGLVPLLVGLACLAFVGIHWLVTSSFSPYKFVGFSGIYLVTLGIFFWALGLLADMNVRIINNQEKIFEELRRHAHKERSNNK